EGRGVRDRGDQGRRRAGRDQRHRPSDPALRRRRRIRRLAAGGDVHARPDAASGRRARRGAQAADRPARAPAVPAAEPGVKIRIGYGLGVQGLRDDGRFGELVDGLEGGGFDSLWLSERLTGTAPDPLVGLAFAAGRTRKLKLGTSVQVLPGRNPAVVAKEWASLDRLSGGRALPAFGLGVANPAEQQAFGVAREERAAWFDEALPLVRRFWTEDAVDHRGPRLSYRRLSVPPKPA